VLELRAPHLIGKPAGPGDLADFRLLHSDPRVMATLSADGKIFTEEQSRAFLESAAEHWKLFNFGLLAFREQASGEFVGYSGIRHAQVEGRDEIELAYAIRSGYWGKRFATEASFAALSLGFVARKIELIVAFTSPDNVASRRVMEHCGFIYQRNIVRAGLPHVLYALDARAFTARIRSANRHTSS
jgi:[ribosomal protein S5]-alanine N-acetyltransferase